jgi:hypothetical protein
MNADGSNRRMLTGDFDRSPQGIIWAPDESGIYYNVESDGWRNLYFSPLAGGVRPITKGSQLLSVTSVNKNGEMVGVSSTSLKPNAVVALSGRNPAIRQLTAVNDGVLAGKTLGQVEEIWYPTSDEMKIQVDREATRLRREEEIPAHAVDPRRAALDVQRRVQLRLAGARVEWLRRAVHEPARVNGATAARSATRSRTRSPGRTSTT